MEDYGYMYIHRLTQFVTTLNATRNCSIDLKQTNSEDSYFLSILYSEPLWEFKKLKVKIGDSFGISNYDLPSRKGYEPQFTEDALEILAVFSKKLPTYTIKDEQDEFIRCEIYQRVLIKVI